MTAALSVATAPLPASSESTDAEAASSHHAEASSHHAEASSHTTVVVRDEPVLPSEEQTTLLGGQPQPSLAGWRPDGPVSTVRPRPRPRSKPRPCCTYRVFSQTCCCLTALATMATTVLSLEPIVIETVWPVPDPPPPPSPPPGIVAPALREQLRENWHSLRPWLVMAAVQACIVLSCVICCYRRMQALRHKQPCEPPRQQQSATAPLKAPAVLAAAANKASPPAKRVVT